MRSLRRSPPATIKDCCKLEAEYNDKDTLTHFILWQNGVNDLITVERDRDVIQLCNKQTETDSCAETYPKDHAAVKTAVEHIELRYAEALDIASEKYEQI